MPSKRAVLQQFKRDELLAAVDRFGLEVRDRRVRDQLVDALAGSRKAHLADILGDMSRDQLKEICRALDLDDSGREKSVLIARLAGTAAPSSTPPAAVVAESISQRPAAPKPAAPRPAGSAETAANLGYEAELWRMADALRGSMDAAEYKHVVLGLRADISIYGQESNYTTWRLAKMNLAIRGIDGQIAHGDTFHNDRHPDLKADFILANPPFNVSDWGGERLAGDKRWQYGTPPRGNANFAWVQHIVQVHRRAV